MKALSKNKKEKWGFESTNTYLGYSASRKER
jgi:hypothetical protein